MKKNILLYVMTMTITFSCSNKSLEAEKLYASAMEYYAKRDFNGAKNFTKAALEIDRNFYQARFLESKIFFFTGDLEQSKKICINLLKKHPEYTEARIWLIRCFIMNNEFEKARMFLEKAFTFNTSDWRIYYLYALLAEYEEDIDTQIAMLKKAETILSNSSKIYEKLSALWEYIGLSEKSEQYKIKKSIIQEEMNGE